MLRSIPFAFLAHIILASAGVYCLVKLSWAMIPLNITVMAANTRFLIQNAAFWLCQPYCCSNTNEYILFWPWIARRFLVPVSAVYLFTYWILGILFTQFNLIFNRWLGFKIARHLRLMSCWTMGVSIWLSPKTCWNQPSNCNAGVSIWLLQKLFRATIFQPEN